MRRILAAASLAALAAASLLATPVTAAGAAAKPPANAAIARLYGKFVMKGRITTARSIRGEHRGQRVLRAWTFEPLCASGPCAQTELVRPRGTGPGAPTDHLILDDRGHGRYVGHGTFYAPLRCAGRVIMRGERVPFTITVQVTRVQPIFGAPFATRINASYTNRRRFNLTRCVAIPGHDAALYSGTLTSGS